jgi:hypothetical protein
MITSCASNYQITTSTPSRVSTPGYSGKAVAKAGKTLGALTKVMVCPLRSTDPGIIWVRIVGMEMVVESANRTKRFVKAISWIIVVVARSQGECL